MERSLVVHYGEIGLKRSNTEYFLKKLIKQIRSKISGKFSIDLKLHHTLGRILIDFGDAVMIALNQYFELSVLLHRPK